MKTLSQHDRVIVVETNGVTINAAGTVDRVRRDGGAWVALDKRSTQGGVHVFPETDDRSTHVLVYPEHCKPARKNHKERRAAKKHDRVSEQPEATFEMFGRDHWSTFHGSFESWCRLVSGALIYAGGTDPRFGVRQS